jgi:hypothetical protein
MFHMYVASLLYMCLQWLSRLFRCFASVSDICYKCFSCFGHMLQVFYVDVTKVDLVLHMLQCDPRATATCSCCQPCIRVRGDGMECCTAAYAGSGEEWWQGCRHSQRAHGTQGSGATGMEGCAESQEAWGVATRGVAREAGKCR